MTGGSITPIPDSVFDGFLSSVRATSVLYGDACDRTVPIVYTPLHGTGALPVTRILREAGFSSVFTVTEQMRPDGDFPTCPYPNPEIPEALSLGMAEAERCGAEMLLATDPDSDRVGVAVKGKDGFTILDGNEVGLLLLDYILSQKKGHGAFPLQPTVVKTVVTTPLADVIAASYGAKTVNVLTGFKYIGDVIGKMEREGRADGYLFGFEESCGYLGGTYVRDKDGVFAAFMIAEMCGFYRAKGVSLADALASLYEKYGKRKNFLHSYTFRGEAGDLSMREMMARMRGGDTPFSDIVSREDYLMAHEDLPPSDVLAFTLSDGCTVTVRPSGTEPKLKLYLSVTGADDEEITARHGALVRAFEEVLPV